MDHATTAPAPLPTDAAEPSRSAADRIADMLADEGYRPRLLEPSGSYRRIDFKAEGTRYQVRLNEDDPDFVAICLGYLFDDPVPHLDAILRAGHDVQSEAKVAKFCLDPECKWYELQAELFLGGGPLNGRQVERCLHALRRAARELHQRLCTEAPRAQA